MKVHNETSWHKTKPLELSCSSQELKNTYSMFTGRYSYTKALLFNCTREDLQLQWYRWVNVYEGFIPNEYELKEILCRGYIWVGITISPWRKSFGKRDMNKTEYSFSMWFYFQLYDTPSQIFIFFQIKEKYKFRNIAITYNAHFYKNMHKVCVCVWSVWKEGNYILTMAFLQFN